MDSILIAALMLMASLLGAAKDSDYKDEIVAAGMAIAHYESRWEPLAVGDHGASLGLYQFNRDGGLGAPYSRDELLDRDTSSRLFFEYLHVHLAAGYSITDTLSPWSVRWQALEMMQGMESATALDWALKVQGD